MKKKLGPKTKTKTIPIRVSQELFDELKKKAIHMSEVARQAWIKALEK